MTAQTDQPLPLWKRVVIYAGMALVLVGVGTLGCVGANLYAEANDLPNHADINVRDFLILWGVVFLAICGYAIQMYWRPWRNLFR